MRGGAVKSLPCYWGLKTLPQRMRSHKVNHGFGEYYWMMHFDALPTNQRDLFKLLRKDPRVIRTTMLKMGE
ncbi:hypothetical protein OF83DRAFT_1223916, partial [Amylostereum chailletii]